MGMIEKKNSSLDSSNPNEGDDSSLNMGDLSSVASKMDFIDAALGVLSEPTRKLPPVGKSESFDLKSVKNNMKLNEPSENTTAPTPALSEKTAAALSRFQAALGKAPKIEPTLKAKPGSKVIEGEKRKTHAEPRQLKRAHELKPEVSLKDIAAELPAATRLPERTLQDLTAEFESSFSSALDYDLSAGPEDSVDLEVKSPESKPVASPVVAAVEKTTPPPPPVETVSKAPPEPKPTYVARNSPPELTAPARPEIQDEDEVITKVAESASTIESPKKDIAEVVQEPVEPIVKADISDDIPTPARVEFEEPKPQKPEVAARVVDSFDSDVVDDDDDEPAPISLQDAVHELELGDLHDKQPDFTYLRHTIRKLHYRYMATSDIDVESREDFETVLKTLSLASVQYRMMKEKYDDYDVVAKERDKEANRFTAAQSSIKEREQSLEKLKMTIASMERDAVETKDRFNSELEDMKNSLVAERESLKFDLERVKSQERKAMQRLEETSERLLESETKLEDTNFTMSSMHEKVALAQAEAEVLRNSLDEACEKIVLITSANMQTELRIQELEDELAAIQTR